MNRFVIRTLIVVICCTCADSGRSQIIGWADAIDAVKGRPELAAATAVLVAEARKEVEFDLVRRVYRLADVGKHRT